MPKISVIIPVYNSEKFLYDCLDSVINQTLTDIEIICINDGSTDGSLKILEDYAQKDNRIKIISQENQGLSETRNVGMKQATGEYLAFLDSDDYISLNYYEALYSRAQETQADIVVCEKVYAARKRGKKLFLKVDKDVVTTNLKKKFECLYLPNFCWVWNKIYKRDKVKVSFLKGFNYEDVYFTTDILHQCDKLAVAEGTSYYYRFHTGTITQTDTNLNRYFKYRSRAYFYEFICNNNVDINFNNYEKVIKEYKILGISVLKIKKRFFKLKYYLFGIPIFKSYI